MTSVVRIKRRLSQEPAEALFLAAKRLRCDHDDASPASSAVGATEKSVFKFCGTTKTELRKEDLENIQRLVEKGKASAHRHVVKPFPHRDSRMKMFSAAASSTKKYKILKAFRNLDEGDLQVYDLVLEGEQGSDVVTCNGVPLEVEECEVPKKDSSEEYVYDFYYSHGSRIDDSYIDSLMTVQIQHCLVEPREDDSDDASDDENPDDENHYGNEYPDTEEDEEDGFCDDLAGKMSGMYLGKGDELSSDDDEEFVYGQEEDPRNGPAWYAYKRRVMKQLNDSNSASDGDEDEDECHEEEDIPLELYD